MNEQPTTPAIAAEPGPAAGRYLWEPVQDGRARHGHAPDSGWILTTSGVRFELFAPTPAMVNIRDIAHALSHACRFGGHTLDFYSVAQHSVIVSHHVPPEEALTALLHDATEAYCGDMVRPLKRQMPAYREVEDRIWEAIRARFDLGPMTPAIKEADERALQTERRDVMPVSTHRWAKDEERAAPFEDVIFPLGPRVAREIFLQRYAELTGLRT